MKIIETALPLHDLAESAIADTVRKGHPGNLHLWWNRSPIWSSEALLYSAMTDWTDSADQNEHNQEIIREMAQGSLEHYPGKESASEDEAHLKIADPFSGFGGLVLSAEALGISAEGSDLNSVASLLTKAACELPERFRDASAVNPGVIQGTLTGADGISSDVLYYGKALKDILQKELQEYYPDQDGKQVYSWIWVRTVECPNPACRCQMPLANSFVLSKTQKTGYWVEPVGKDGKISFTIHEGQCPEEKETNKIGSHDSKFRCPICGEIAQDAYIRIKGKEHKIHNQLMAVSVLEKDGRKFYSPDQHQIACAQVPVPENQPIGALADNKRWFSPPGFGYTEYKDLFTDRQLLFLTTLADTIEEIRKKVEEDAVQSGMADDHRTFEEGGSGAFAYSQAIATYLSLVVGKLANGNSAACTWDNRHGNVRGVFSRQAIPMTWVFPEGNPFSTVTGNFESMLRNVAESIPCAGGASSIKVTQQDAVSMEFPENSVLFTELPYLDNVGYADLSDFFYVWLRKCLKEIYPSLFEKVVTSKEELCTIPEHYGGDTAKAAESYRNGIQSFLNHFYPKASVQYPSMIFFAYSKEDEAAICEDATGKKPSPFEMFLECILKTGFKVTAIWPVRMNRVTKDVRSVRTLVVFRKETEDRGQTTRRGFINTLKHELPDLLNTAFQEGVDPEDRSIVALGMGMSIYSKYRRVLNADGSDMTVHETMVLIHQEAESYIAGETGEEKPEV